MAELINDFEAYVADGSIVGTGSGLIAKYRLKTFRELLDTASHLIARATSGSPV